MGSATRVCSVSLGAAEPRLVPGPKAGFMPPDEGGVSAQLCGWNEPRLLPLGHTGPFSLLLRVWLPRMYLQSDGGGGGDGGWVEGMALLPALRASSTAFRSPTVSL